MATAKFTPSDYRIPSVVLKVFLEKGAGLLKVGSDNVVIGYRDSTVPATFDDELVEVESRADTQSKFGAGSILDLAMKEYLDARNVILDLVPAGTMSRLFMIPVAPPVGPSVAAEYTYTVTGVPTVNGTARIDVGQERFSIAVAPTDTVTDIATRITETVGLRANDLFVTVSSALGVVTSAAREIGEIGNDVYHAADTTDAPGITITVAQSVPGTGVVSMVNALDATFSSEVNVLYVSCLQSDSQTALDLKAHIEESDNITNQSPRGAMFPADGDLSNAETEAIAIDNYRVMVTSNEKLVGVGTPFHPESGRSMITTMTVGAMAVLGSQINRQANFNFNKVRIPGHGRVNLSPLELNDSINGGVTVFAQDGQNAILWNPVSCALTDQTGQTASPDKTWQPWEYMMVIWATWQQFGFTMEKYTKAPGTQITLDDSKVDSLAILRQEEDLQWIGPVNDSDVVTDYDTVTAAPGKILVTDVQLTPLLGVGVVEISLRVQTEG